MSRRGMTLVEMLVAMTATLLLMAAVAQAFAVFGSAITGSRGVLDLDARMRSAAWRLRSDLAGITVRPLPPITPESAQGYLEIIEGPVTDSVFRDLGTGLPLPIGPTDVDDVLLFTTQSSNPLFVGRAPGSGQTFESTVAEVAWFARPTPNAAGPSTYTLYRKQLLVMGYVGVAPFSNGDSNSVDWATAGSSWSAFYNAPCDVSVRREVDASGSFDRLIPNTLADLSRREARFLHNIDGITDRTAFSYTFVPHQTQTPPSGLIFAPGTPRQGEDVVLTDVIAFDVRVFDPVSPVVVQTNGTAIGPGDDTNGDGIVNAGDLAFWNSTAAGDGTGSYVDLGHLVTRNSILQAAGINPRFSSSSRDITRPGATQTVNLTRTYDTWSLAYEANGRDEDGDSVTDNAFDGSDNDGNNLIDDPAEFETRPPYPYPLRGIEVRIRCYEPESRQVRQVTIRHTFVPH